MLVEQTIVDGILLSELLYPKSISLILNNAFCFNVVNTLSKI